MGTKNAKWEEEVLQQIVGVPLSSVEFVMDYVQLRFGGPTLTLTTLPTVEVDSKVFLWNELGFRDELCNQIGRRVVAARIVPGESIQIEFEHGARVRVSLRPEDYVTVEAAEFRTDAVWWVL